MCGIVFMCLHGSRCRIDCLYLQITHSQQVHTTPDIVSSISHFCCVVLSSFTLNHLSPLCARARTERPAPSQGQAQGSFWDDKTKQPSRSSIHLTLTSHPLLLFLHLHHLLICLLYLQGKSRIQQHQARIIRGK